MTKTNLLFRILFLTSLMILIANDLYLKYEYHNYVTGKLSDFAGLFALPYFLSVIISKRIEVIYISIGILFIYWKSEISQPIIELAYSYAIPLNRTVDYSDLIALVVLPLSYKYFNSNVVFGHTLQKRILLPIIVSFSMMTFIATSMPEYYQRLDIKSNFTTNVKYDFKATQEKFHIYNTEVSELKYYRIELPEQNAYVIASIKILKIDDDITAISLDSLYNFAVQGNGFILYAGIDDDNVEHLQNLTLKDFENIFEKQIQNEFSKN